MKLKKKQGKQILKKDWVSCVESHEELIWEFERLNFLVEKNIDASVYFKVDTLYGELTYDEKGTCIEVFVEDRFFWKVFPVLKSINNFLGTSFFKENGTPYLLSEIEALKKLDYRCEEDLSTRHHELSFGENSSWVALKNTDVKTVLNYFKAKRYSLANWDEGFQYLKSNDWGLIILTIREWTVIVGDVIKILFAQSLFFNTKSFDDLVFKLEFLSKHFEEAHYYSHSNKWYSFNAYFKAHNGKLIYGKYSCEDFEYEKGKIPSILKSLSSLGAADVAHIWSIDPRLMPYFKEVENYKVFVL